MTQSTFIVEIERHSYSKSRKFQVTAADLQTAQRTAVEAAANKVWSEHSAEYVVVDSKGA